MVVCFVEVLYVLICLKDVIMFHLTFSSYLQTTHIWKKNNIVKMLVTSLEGKCFVHAKIEVS